MPLTDVPLINGKAYSWSSIKFILAGVTVVGITAINYSDDVEKENGYGQGQMPIDRGEGNYKAESGITLKANEVEALTEKAPNGRIQDFGVFDIIVFYLVGTKKVTHKIRNAEFTGNKRDIKQGDKIIEVQLPLIISHIDWK
ncbi:MAG: hypothetical protein Q8K66_13125 [Sediminibacterium sp.]|nr:hypothetical protein [Sediminibacterium sp.]MDP3128823.1 hypothetical protein [Sediminibacterium sp.]